MLTRRGFTERGAQKRFAKHAKITEPTLSRLLRASGKPDITTLESLATALQVPLSELLVRAGVVKQADIDALRRVDPQPLTTQAAAVEFGITSPEGVATFERTVKGLQATEPTPHPAKKKTGRREDTTG